MYNVHVYCGICHEGFYTDCNEDLCAWCLDRDDYQICEICDEWVPTIDSPQGYCLDCYESEEAA